MARTARGLAHWANVLVGATIRKVEIDVSSSGWYESGGEVESAELERLTIVGTDGKVYRLDACSHNGYGATIELRAPDPLSDATGQGRR